MPLSLFGISSVLVAPARSLTLIKYVRLRVSLFVGAAVAVVVTIVAYPSSVQRSGLSVKRTACKSGSSILSHPAGNT